jgi:biotin carboxylase
MKRRALLAGSSYSAAPLLFALKRRELHVTVCGNLHTDPCHLYADESAFFDYSDRDRLSSFVRDNGVDFVVPSCNDTAYMACAWVAEQRGLPGFDRFDTADLISHKGRFRRALQSIGLPVPRAFTVEEAENAIAADLPYPLLVKPVDSSGGRGMTRLAGPQGLDAAIGHAKHYSGCGDAVIEQFVEGRLYSHSAFVKDQGIVFDVFVDEFCTVFPFQVDCSNHPSSLPEAMRQMVRLAILRLVDEFKLADGLLHTQFIAAGDDFWIIECMRRSPGDLYYDLVRLSVGIDYVDHYIRPFVGETLPAAIEMPTVAKPFGRHTISVREESVVQSFTCRIPGKEVSIVPLKTAGEKLGAAPHDKLAILFVEFRSQAEMLDVTPRMASLVFLHSPEGTAL